MRLITSRIVSLTQPTVLRMAAIVLAGALAVSACGQGSASSSPAVKGVPLAGGTRVVFRVRRCDRGAHPFCALQLVVVGPRYGSSADLLSGETARLREAGWGAAEGDTAKERAAESPGHRLRLTYATARDDLQSIDAGAITRAPSVARSLSRQVFDRTPALSLMLQAGSA